MAKAARVQQAYKGADAHLTHKLVKPGTVDGINVGYVPVQLQAGDTATVGYAAQQPDDPNATPVPDVYVAADVPGSFPTDEITVHITPTDTAKLAVGEGHACRVLIARSGGEKEALILHNELDVIDSVVPTTDEDDERLP